MAKKKPYSQLVRERSHFESQATLHLTERNVATDALNKERSAHVGTKKELEESIGRERMSSLEATRAQGALQALRGAYISLLRANLRKEGMAWEDIDRSMVAMVEDRFNGSNDVYRRGY